MNAHATISLSLYAVTAGQPAGLRGGLALEALLGPTGIADEAVAAFWR